MLQRSSLTSTFVVAISGFVGFGVAGRRCGTGLRRSGVPDAASAAAIGILPSGGLVARLGGQKHEALCGAMPPWFDTRTCFSLRGEYGVQLSFADRTYLVTGGWQRYRQGVAARSRPGRGQRDDPRPQRRPAGGDGRDQRPAADGTVICTTADVTREDEIARAVEAVTAGTDAYTGLCIVPAAHERSARSPRSTPRAGAPPSTST